jgi:hypothetical protein
VNRLMLSICRFTASIDTTDYSIFVNVPFRASRLYSSGYPLGSTFVIE